jgi:hypothetical protein
LGSKITAAATTEPTKGPRPASSTPATNMILLTKISCFRATNYNLFKLFYFITSDTQAFIVFATATPVNAVLAFESTAAKASSDGDNTVGAFLPTHLQICFFFCCFWFLVINLLATF